jgi:hypothetical protein
MELGTYLYLQALRKTESHPFIMVVAELGNGSSTRWGNGSNLCPSALWDIGNDLDSIRDCAIGIEDGSIPH